MTVLDERSDLAPGLEADALFKEVHQRRRRRRSIVGALVIAFVVAMVATAVTLTAPSSSPRLASTSIAPPSLPPVTTGPSLLAWVDYNGALHIGTSDGTSQRVVAMTQAEAITPVVWLGANVFWVNNNPSRPFGPTVNGFDTATQQSFTVTTGFQIFPSLDHSLLYVQKDAQHLAEYSTKAGWIGHVLTVPKGWGLLPPILLNNPEPATAQGILVASPSPSNGHPFVELPTPTLGIRNPATGRVRSIARIWKVVGSSTKVGGRTSTIAWLAASCLKSLTHCRLALTDTSTLSTRFVNSPFAEGFAFGGGFSPNGAELATFIGPGQQERRLIPKQGGLSPITQLALVNRKTGSIRAVPGAVVNIGDALAWAVWLPGGRYLIAGGVESPDGVPNDNHYLVDTTTGHARPFSFYPGGGQADGDLDVNFSVSIQGGK